MEETIKTLQLQNEVSKEELRQIKAVLEKLQNERQDSVPFVFHTPIQNGHIQHNIVEDEIEIITDGTDKPLTKKVELETIEEKTEKPVVQTEVPKKVDTYVEDTLKSIKNVKKDAAELEERVKYYKGSPGERIYKQFNEQIIKYLIKLDRIDNRGSDELRNAKKEAVEYIKQIQAILKAR